MELRFVKARHRDRPHTLTCVRDDGTSVGQTSTEFFIAHDLTHFAVESTLALDEAFYGLLNRGWTFESFSEKQRESHKSRVLPTEAIYAELLVSSYDLERTAGPLPDNERLQRFDAQCKEAGLARFEVSPEQLAEIRRLRDELFAKWTALAEGEVLGLTFPPKG